jgi:hypothetical protein
MSLHTARKNATCTSQLLMYLDFSNFLCTLPPSNLWTANNPPLNARPTHCSGAGAPPGLLMSQQGCQAGDGGILSAADSGEELVQSGDTEIVPRESQGTIQTQTLSGDPNL